MNGEMLNQTVIPDQHVTELPLMAIAKLGFDAMYCQHFQNFRGFPVGNAVDPFTFAGNDENTSSVRLPMRADNGMRHWRQ